MKHRRISLGWTALIWVGLSLASAGAQPADTQPLIDQLQGKVEAPARTAEQLKTAYEQVVRALLPGMGAENISDRQQPQQTLQNLCWHASRPGAENERAAASAALLSGLASDAPQPAREWLLRQLEFIGRGEAVPALRALLSDQDTSLRELARRALQRNPDPGAGQALADALDKARDSAWQVALINALSYRGEQSQAPALRKYLTATDEAVRCAALTGVAELGDAASADALLKARKSGGVTVRSTATDAVLKLAEVLAARGDRKAALPLYRALLDESDYVKCGALIGIARAGGLAELPVLFAALEDADPQYQGAAKQGLALLPAAEVNTAIVAKLKTATPEFKVTLLEALSQNHDPDLLPVLVAAAADETSEVRLVALRAMGDLGAEGAAPTLAECIATGEGEELKVAQSSLTRLGGASVLTEIEKAIGTAPVAGRVRLIETLGARPGAETVKLLEKTAVAPEGEVRLASIEVLSKLAQPDSLNFLLDRLLEAGDDDERHACEDAVGALCWRAEDKEPLSSIIGRRYRSGGATEKVALLPLFPLLGGDAALAEVQTAWKSGDAELQAVALQALSDWPDLAAADDLLNIARTDKRSDLQRLAFRGYLQVVGNAPNLAPELALERLKTALAAAPAVDDKKLALARLGGVASPAAFAVVREYLGEPQLRQDAEAALLRLGESLRWDAPQESADAVALVQKSEEPTLRDRAKALAADFAKYEGYLETWLVSGPWTEKGKKYEALFETVFPPETEEGLAMDWKTLPERQPEKRWQVDLGQCLGSGNDRAGYLRSWVWSDKAQTAVLEVGSDDGFVAWLNGKKVLEFRATRALAPGQDRADVQLTAGANELLLKVINSGSDWAGAARLRAPDGSRLAGVVRLGQADYLPALLAGTASAQKSTRLALAAFDAVVAIEPPGKQMKSLLQAAARLSEDEALADRAKRRLADFERNEGHLTQWQAAGPYVATGKDGGALFDQVFPPETDKADTVAWKPVSASGPYLVLLERIFGGSDRVAYLRTWVIAPEETPARLELGSDDGVKAWLNGELVHANNVARPTAPGQDQVDVTLRKGANLLLLKITQGGGHWSACARFRSRDGEALEGLTCQATPPTE